MSMIFCCKKEPLKFDVRENNNPNLQPRRNMKQILTFTAAALMLGVADTARAGGEGCMTNKRQGEFAKNKGREFNAFQRGQKVGFNHMMPMQQKFGFNQRMPMQRQQNFGFQQRMPMQSQQNFGFQQRMPMQQNFGFNQRMPQVQQQNGYNLYRYRPVQMPTYNANPLQQPFRRINLR